MIEEGIVSLLKADAEMTALLSGRIYAVVLPRETKTFPALTYQVVSGNATWSLDSTRFAEKRIQFDAWGVRYSDCKAVLKRLTQLLDGYSGNLPGPQSSPLSDEVRMISAFIGVTIDNFQSDSTVYRSLTEFIFQYTEA